MKIILLTKRQQALVDDADYEWLSQWKWRANWSVTTKCYYAERTSEVGGVKRSISMHRRILGLQYGDGLQGDHKNGVGLDNQRHNLRIATCAHNIFNRGRNSNNRSGFKGVSFHRQSGRWRASITLNGKQNSLGLFVDAESAHAAYREAAKTHHGDFANFGVHDSNLGETICQPHQ